MTIDYAELRRLAEAATHTAMVWPEVSEAAMAAFPNLMPKEAVYLAAMSPIQCLALLDDIEELERENDERESKIFELAGEVVSKTQECGDFEENLVKAEAELQELERQLAKYGR